MWVIMHEIKTIEDSYDYVESWDVGFFSPDSSWFKYQAFPDQAAAENHCHFLNGRDRVVKP